MSVNELKFVKSLSDKGYSRESEFSLLHIGCGCGNMLGRIHYMYPKAKLYGVEENSNAREFAIPCAFVTKSTDDLPVALSNIDIVVEGLG